MTDLYEQDINNLEFIKARLASVDKCIPVPEAVSASRLLEKIKEIPQEQAPAPKLTVLRTRRFAGVAAAAVVIIGGLVYMNSGLTASAPKASPSSPDIAMAQAEPQMAAADADMGISAFGGEEGLLAADAPVPEDAPALDAPMLAGAPAADAPVPQPRGAELKGTAGLASGAAAVADYVYTGADEALALVYSAAVAQNSPLPMGYADETSFTVPAVKIIEKYEETEKLKIFAIVKWSTYTQPLEHKVMAQSGGSDIFSFTYVKTEGAAEFEAGEVLGLGIKEDAVLNAFCAYPVSGGEIPGLAAEIASPTLTAGFTHDAVTANLVEHLNANNLTGISLVTDYDDSITLLTE